MRETEMEVSLPSCKTLKNPVTDGYERDRSLRSSNCGSAKDRRFVLVFVV